MPSTDFEFSLQRQQSEWYRMALTFSGIGSDSVFVTLPLQHVRKRPASYDLQGLVSSKPRNTFQTLGGPQLPQPLLRCVPFSQSLSSGPTRSAESVEEPPCVQALLATLCTFMDDMVRYKFLHVIPTIITCMQKLGHILEFRLSFER